MVKIGVGNPLGTTIQTTEVDDNSITLAKLSDGTQGGIIYYGAAGAPTELAAGTNGHYLKTGGAGANPSWAAVSAISQRATFTGTATVLAKIGDTATVPAGSLTNLQTVKVRVWYEGGDDAGTIRVRYIENAVTHEINKVVSNNGYGILEVTFMQDPTTNTSINSFYIHEDSAGGFTTDMTRSTAHTANSISQQFTLEVWASSAGTAVAVSGEVLY